MRATATSFTNSSTAFHARSAPPAVWLAELSRGVGPPPISASSTAPSAPDTMQCAHGHSGCSGVSTNGSHPRVAALPFGVADRRHRAPEVVRVLRFEHGDERIVHGHRRHGEEARVVAHIAARGVRHGAGDGLVGRLAGEADAAARRLADLAPSPQRLTKRLPAIQ
jgi:hypothetical protein